MKKNNYLLLVIVLLTLVGFTIYSCSKQSDPISKSEEIVDYDKKNFKELSVNGIKGDKEIAIAISKDPLWQGLKKTSDELTAILVLHNIDLKDARNFEEGFFYSRLGNDADKYKIKFKKGKEFANQLVSKYFSTYEVCSPCAVMTSEKMKLYAQKLDEIKSKTMSSRKTTLATTSSEYAGGPSCWNWQFFACGGICAATIVDPPLFALCIALCYDAYCK